MDGLLFPLWIVFAFPLCIFPLLSMAVFPWLFGCCFTVQLDDFIVILLFTAWELLSFSFDVSNGSFVGQAVSACTVLQIIYLSSHSAFRI